VTPRLRLAEAATSLAPLQQGDLDRLCGLYAIINAIRLALYPQHKLSRRQLRILFDEGIAFLSRTRSLKAAASSGMYEAQWSKLCQHLLFMAGNLAGVELHMMRYPARSLSSTTVALKALKHHLKHGRPVLLALEGRLNHWTVVVRFSDKRLSLFDSDGHRWILNSSLSVRACDHEKAYRVFARGIVALRPEDR
jgi:hypothetical protein